MATETDNFTGIKWQVEPDLAELRDLLRTGNWHTNAAVVDRNSKRTVYRFTRESNGFYLKHDHPIRWRDRVKTLWRCKTRMEFDAFTALQQKGVPTVPIVAWGTRDTDGFLVSAELPGIVGFRDAWNKRRTNPEQRRELLAATGDLLAKMVAAQVAHPDLHAGNVMVVPTAGNRVRLVLVDLYGVRTGVSLDLQTKQRLFTWLMPILPDLNWTERKQLLTNVSHAPACNPNRAWTEIARKHAVQFRKRWRGRCQRLLSDSSLCELRNNPDGKWLLRRPFSFDHATKALAAHDRNIEQQQNLVKTDVKRRLTRVTVQGTTFVVKEFLRPGPEWCRAADRRSWLNSYRLEALHIPATRAHAWVRRSDSRGFLILQDVGSMALRDVMHDADADEIHRLVRSAARMVAWLHNCGVYHGDLKLTNFVPSTVAGRDQMSLALVDLDSVRVPLMLTMIHRTRNLAQLLESLPAEATAWDRGRLLVAYRRETGLDREDLRDLLGRLRDKPELKLSLGPPASSRA